MRVTQQATNYPHTLHHTKYLVSYVRIHTISTSHKFSSSPIDNLINSDSDNFGGFTKVIPGQVKTAGSWRDQLDTTKMLCEPIYILTNNLNCEIEDASETHTFKLSGKSILLCTTKKVRRGSQPREYVKQYKYHYTAVVSSI